MKFKDFKKKLDKIEAEILELHKNKVDKERLRLIEKEVENIGNLNLYLFDILKDLRNHSEAQKESSGPETRENQQSVEKTQVLDEVSIKIPKDITDLYEKPVLKVLFTKREAEMAERIIKHVRERSRL